MRSERGLSHTAMRSWCPVGYGTDREVMSAKAAGNSVGTLYPPVHSLMLFITLPPVTDLSGENLIMEKFLKGMKRDWLLQKHSWVLRVQGLLLEFATLTTFSFVSLQKVGVINLDYLDYYCCFHTARNRAFFKWSSYTALLTKELYNVASHSPIHTHTQDGGCHAPPRATWNLVSCPRTLRCVARRVGESNHWLCGLWTALLTELQLTLWLCWKKAS